MWFISPGGTPKFRGIHFTSVRSSDAPVLRTKINVLLVKDAIEPVPPADMKAGFYSSYFIVPKKGGGLQPILDLQTLNWALHKLPFKMLMQKHIFECIRPWDWFAAIDLKDAYFYVSILSRHRPFLRFAFEGRAYQYKVLPFGLSLSPHVFTKFAEAAIVPLREHGVRILNYLDDWLIVAQSRYQLCEHRDMVLCHLSLLGLRVNWEKSSSVQSWTRSTGQRELQRSASSQGGHVQRACSVGSVDGASAALAHQLPPVASSTSCAGLPQGAATWSVWTCWSVWTIIVTVAYINCQGGLRSHRMWQLACHLLLWSQKHLRSLQAIHIPGVLSRAADELSR